MKTPFRSVKHKRPERSSRNRVGVCVLGAVLGSVGFVARRGPSEDPGGAEAAAVAAIAGRAVSPTAQLAVDGRRRKAVKKKVFVFLIDGIIGFLFVSLLNV